MLYGLGDCDSLNSIMPKRASCRNAKAASLVANRLRPLRVFLVAAKCDDAPRLAKTSKLEVNELPRLKLSKQHDCDDGSLIGSPTNEPRPVGKPIGKCVSALHGLNQQQHP